MTMKHATPYEMNHGYIVSGQVMHNGTSDGFPDMLYLSKAVIEEGKAWITRVGISQKCYNLDVMEINDVTRLDLHTLP
ncbi:hypothetical protein C5167_020063 [Papaver somniferum]|uniref:Uncharacterized protein n=1 Tax=Papaver somniferum TaxID=3469 RepID=A0A4Y7IVV4_PAPSO|nr:hypothetical protein C5167_020063 [Papaver somniferum]